MHHWASAPARSVRHRGHQQLASRAPSGWTRTCNDTALDTTWVTSGQRAATAAIVKLIEPLTVDDALHPSLLGPLQDTAWTAAGWSDLATRSSVYWRGGRSIEPRQFWTQTS